MAAGIARHPQLQHSGAVLACVLTALLATLHYPGRLWVTLQRRLPLLLSVPHAAFAVGLFFLLAPSGWLARAVAQVMGWGSPPDWITVQDPYGLSLALALTIKESWFLLWVLAAVLAEQSVTRQMVMVAFLNNFGRASRATAAAAVRLRPTRRLSRPAGSAGTSSRVREVKVRR